MRYDLADKSHAVKSHGVKSHGVKSQVVKPRGQTLSSNPEAIQQATLARRRPPAVPPPDLEALQSGGQI